jgi:hypothetical protein
MSIRRSFVLTALLLALAMVLPSAALAAKKMGKPSMMKGCKACHEAESNTLRGKFVGFSEKFHTVSVNVGKLVWVVKYDDKTGGTKTLTEMKKNKEMKLVWTGTDKKPVATLIKPKPPLKVPDEKLMSFEEVKALIQKSPKEGKYTLIDSRPPTAYMSGHVPFAKSLPYPKLKKKGAAALPKDKDDLLIFYCGGFA